MAHKDHSLDVSIAEAAMREFLENGFEKASLRKIAAEADVTIGAIYTRYRTKDLLFCSLAEPLISAIRSAFTQIKGEYDDVRGQEDPETFLSAVQSEAESILHLLFDQYDRAVLLLGRSAGSSLEHFLDQLAEKKISETLSFFQKTGFPHPEPNVLNVLIHAEFQMYSRIIRDGYALEEAKTIMNDIMRYHTGGWAALLGLRLPDEKEN